jgi:hypothetical protein
MGVFICPHKSDPAFNIVVILKGYEAVGEKGGKSGGN